MYRVFLSLLILSAALLNPLFVLAESRTIVTRRPVYNNRFNNRHYHRPPNRYYNNRRPYYRPNNFYNNAYNQRRFFHPRRSSFSDLSALEQYTLNRNFTRESDLERLQRLEMQAFGAVHYQGNQSDFTKKLKRGSREADETCYCRPLYKLKFILS